ncbi:hypothetical protein SCLCIDRAFT_1222606 [Scleroderma citrinum Foug A]|uniref:Uncharacterized protein n=1 Tax=Scleroderma citrinum Foug A TaxID=1036808 RepID=A0A0C3DB80_9AGAM|nr:hypothetical protein SCLCIDRAFT_1222606 [Scleroderma citrinum Foug A]
MHTPCTRQLQCHAMTHSLAHILIATVLSLHVTSVTSLKSSLRQLASHDGLTPYSIMHTRTFSPIGYQIGIISLLTE